MGAVGGPTTVMVYGTRVAVGVSFVGFRRRHDELDEPLVHLCGVR